jgi:hypothetical protein
MARQLIERTFSIDVRRLKREGHITASATAVVLCTSNGRTKVRLTHLARPVIGGFRTYFHCPGCDRRCDLLYAGSHLACRFCLNLAFSSENEPKASRALRRLIKVRERLGQVDGGVIAPFPSKPRWGRWPSYLRVRREALRREAEYWHALGIRLGIGRRG